MWSRWRVLWGCRWSGYRRSGIPPKILLLHLRLAQLIQNPPLNVALSQLSRTMQRNLTTPQIILPIAPGPKLFPRLILNLQQPIVDHRVPQRSAGIGGKWQGSAVGDRGTFGEQSNNILRAGKPRDPVVSLLRSPVSVLLR
jgi:hypothetical protein